MPCANLPSYRNPPVVETVVGVQFERIQGWGLPFLGLYWNTIRDEFPTFETKSEIASVVESESPYIRRHSEIEFTESPDVRCWFLAPDGNSLVQLQADRFLLNWRKQPKNAEYPRHEFSRQRFETLWTGFCKFLESQGLARPNITQCEVTYVNHIPKGEGWSSGADWGEVFTCICPTAIDLPEPVESCLFQLTHAIPENRGRLRVSASQALRAIAPKEVIVLELTARGRPNSSADSDILGWIDTGREWIVRGFTSLTTESMHRRWGKE